MDIYGGLKRVGTGIGKGFKSVFWDNWNDYSRNSSMATQIFAGILGLAAMAAVAYFAAPLLLASVSGLGTAAAVSATTPGIIGIVCAGVAAGKITTELVKTGIGGISDGIKKAGQSMDERAIKNEAKKATKQEKKAAKEAAKAAEKEAKEADKQAKKENNIRDAKLEALTTDLDKQSKKQGKGGTSGLGTKHENAAQYYSDKMSRLVKVTADSLANKDGKLSDLSGKQLAELSKAIEKAWTKAQEKGKDHLLDTSRDRLYEVQKKIDAVLKDPQNSSKFDEFILKDGKSELVKEAQEAQQKKSDIGAKLDAKVAEFETKNFAELSQTVRDGKLNGTQIDKDIQAQLGHKMDMDNPADMEVARQVIAKHSVTADLKAEKLQAQQQQANALTAEQKTQKRAEAKAADITDIMSELAGVSVSNATGQQAQPTSKQNQEQKTEQGHSV